MLDDATRARETAVLSQGVVTICGNVLGGDSPLTPDTGERLQEMLVALGQAQVAESPGETVRAFA